MSAKPSKAQRALLGRLRDGALLFEYRPPGSDGPSRWAIRDPYSDEDGRTCASLAQRGWVHYIGDSDWVITPAGLAALDRG